MVRNSYLMKKYINYYLTASLLTMAVSNANSIIDGILMGNFLGPAALAAINLAMPVQFGILALVYLLVSGAGMLCARAIGGMDFVKVHGTFSVSILSVIFAGIIGVIVAFTGIDWIVDLLCSGNSGELNGMVRDYSFVSICTCMAIMLDQALGQMVDVAGQPRMVTKAMLLSVVVNVVCDILYVYVLGGGIAFAALATSTGYLVSTIYLLTYMKAADCPYKLILTGLKPFIQMKENIINGVSASIMMVVQMLLLLVINHYVQNALGTPGLFVVSIGVTLITVSFSIVDGIIMSFFSIGSMLIGQEDWQGTRMMFKYCIRLAVISVLVFMVAGVLFSGNMASLYGADNPGLLELAHMGLPMISLYLPGLAMAVVLGITYQILGLGIVAPIESITSFFSVAAALELSSRIFPAENIWYAFPIASIIVIIGAFTISEFVRHGSAVKRSRITLMPLPEENTKVFDTSVQLNEKGISSALTDLTAFCKTIISAELCNKVNICIEELLINIAQHGNHGAGHFADVKIVVDADFIAAGIRDDGRPFDPVTCSEKQQQFGLKLLHANCHDMNYRYSFGQNVTVLVWEL